MCPDNKTMHLHIVYRHFVSAIKLMKVKFEVVSFMTHLCITFVVVWFVSWKTFSVNVTSETHLINDNCW